MAAGAEIRIDGLRELQASLKALDGQSQKMLRLVLNDVVNIVADAARPMMPHISGDMKGSVKAQSTQRVGQVKGGGGKVPYFGFIEFGGSVGRNRSVHRTFVKGGRYLFPAYRAHRPEIEARLAKGLTELIQKSGLG